MNGKEIPAENPAEKSDTGGGRPVYTRELPPGRELVSAAPGAYFPDGYFSPWESLSPCVTETGELTYIRGAGRHTGGVLVLPENVLSLGKRVFLLAEWEGIILPQGLRTVKQEAFAYSHTPYVRFPSSPVRAAADAFSYACLRHAVLPERSSVSGRGVFTDCRNLMSAYIPGKKTGAGV